MKNLDHKLLVDHPEFWRTRAHYFFYYSFVLGNIAAVILPFLLIRSNNAVTINQVEVIYSVLAVFFGFCFLYWGYTQFKFKLKSGEFKHTLATILVYIFCIGSLFSNVFTLNMSITTRLATIAQTSNWESDIAFLKKYNYLNGYGAFFNNKFSFLHDTGFYGSEEEWADSFTSVLERMNAPVPLDGDIFTYSDSRHLKKKIRAIEQSREYLAHPFEYIDYSSTRFHDMVKTSAMFTLMLCIIIPPVLLLLSTVGFYAVFTSLLMSFIAVIGTVFLTFFFGVDSYEALVSNFVIISILGSTILLFNRRNSLGWRMLSQVLLLIIPFTVLFSIAEHISLYKSMEVLLLGVFLSVILTSTAAILNTYLRSRPQV
ncbi:MAG: hypothetical protein AAF502_15130 [Bacteroidota bacterium]